MTCAASGIVWHIKLFTFATVTRTIYLFLWCFLPSDVLANVQVCYVYAAVYLCSDYGTQTEGRQSLH